MTFEEAVALHKAEEKVNSNPLLKEAKQENENREKEVRGSETKRGL